MSDQTSNVTKTDSSARKNQVAGPRAGGQKDDIRSLPADIQREIARLKKEWPDAFNAKFREYTVDGSRFGCRCSSLRAPRNDTRDGRLVELLQLKKLLTNKAFVERWRKIAADAKKGESGEAKNVKCDCNPAPIYPFYPNTDYTRDYAQPILFRIFQEKEVIRDPMDPFHSIMRPLYDSMFDSMRFRCHAVKEDEPIFPIFDFDSLGSYPDFQQISQKNNNKFNPKLLIPSQEQYYFLIFNPIRLLSL